MDFQTALEKHFKFTGRASRDNLPALAMARFHWGEKGDHGRQALARMIADLGYREGVEIGTLRGDSAVMFLEQAPKLHLTCVDPYARYNARHSQESQDEIFVEATKRLRPYNADIVREFSMDAVESFEDGSIDFVNIDGNHEFDPVMQDLICWARKVRRGGLIMLHDYCTLWWGGIVRAVDAYTMAHRVDPWYVTRDHLPTAFWRKGDERVK